MKCMNKFKKNVYVVILSAAKDLAFSLECKPGDGPSSEDGVRKNRTNSGGGPIRSASARCFGLSGKEFHPAAPFPSG
jgi:hypothetical protein